VATEPLLAVPLNRPETRSVTDQANNLLSRRAATFAIALVSLAALVVTLVSATGGTTVPTTASTATAPSTGDKSATITINNFEFIPAKITVSPGETIRVHNEDPVAHTLTAIPGSTPDGKFDSGNIAAGATKTVTAPKQSGTYQYFCSIHNFMTGSLTVKS
jgi:plastocyanin